MNDLICYKTMLLWDAHSLPKAFQNKHNTKSGTWAKLTISKGQLTYYALDEHGNVLHTDTFDKDSDIPFIEPQAWHKVEPASDDLECQLQFYCQPHDYYLKKYKLTAVHSEVLGLQDYNIFTKASGKHSTALDVGCGKGRNSLYLQQQGFHVTGLDKNPRSIGQLQEVIAQESLNNIAVHDVNLNHIESYKHHLTAYDVIISTVVFMFLEAEKISDIISTMQQHTKVGGYNMIVCAMDTQDLHYDNYQLSFTFGFKENELLAYYDGWKIHKYNENIGRLHRSDENGNPIKLHFATLVAEKL